MTKTTLTYISVINIIVYVGLSFGPVYVDMCPYPGQFDVFWLWTRSSGSCEVDVIIISSSGPGGTAPSSGSSGTAPSSGPSGIALSSGPGQVDLSSDPGYVRLSSDPGYRYLYFCPDYLDLLVQVRLVSLRVLISLILAPVLTLFRLTCTLLHGRAIFRFAMILVPVRLLCLLSLGQTDLSSDPAYVALSSDPGCVDLSFGSGHLCLSSGFEYADLSSGMLILCPILVMADLSSGP